MAVHRSEPLVTHQFACKSGNLLHILDRLYFVLMVFLVVLMDDLKLLLNIALHTFMLQNICIEMAPFLVPKLFHSIQQVPCFFDVHSFAKQTI